MSEYPKSPYIASPKIIILSGMSCSGKTSIANSVAQQLSIPCISQDDVKNTIQKEKGLTGAQISHHSSYKVYKLEFKKRIRSIRYSDFIIEGVRLAVPFVLESFIDALKTEYGDYCFFGSFHLEASPYARLKRLCGRKFHLLDCIMEESQKSNPNQAKLEKLTGMLENPFRLFSESPEGFQSIKDETPIINWYEKNIDSVHPDFPIQHEELFKRITQANSPFSPFYQTVEVDGKRIINGFTQSYYSWENVLELPIDWKGKRVCEVGSNHGYYLFRAEELGAECTGIELNESSVNVSKTIAEYTQSKVKFKVGSATDEFKEHYDILLAMNVLHYMEDLPAAIEHLCNVANSLIFEVGEGQIPQIIPSTKKCGFKLLKTIQSHRKQSVIGDRYLFYFSKT